MANQPTGVKGKYENYTSKSGATKKRWRDPKGNIVRKKDLKVGFQKTYAKQYAQDLGQSAWREQETASRKAAGVRRRAAGTRRVMKAKGRRKAA